MARPGGGRSDWCSRADVEAAFRHGGSTRTPRQAGDYGGQALRLAKYFGTSAEFWINLRSHYELDRAEDRAGEQIASITPLRVA